MDLADRTVPELRELAEEYYQDHGWPEIEALDTAEPNARKFQAEVWARKAVATDELPERLDRLQELARDEDWRVRESVAMACKYVNEHAFEAAEPAWADWIRHEDNYVRRTCEVGLMGIRSEHVGPALELFEHVVSDSDDYVKKSCGGFALSFVASKDPDVARPYLDRWSRADDLRTRWNVAKAIGGAYGGETDHALELAYRLSGDDEYRVRQATTASIRELSEGNPEVREHVEQWGDRSEFRSLL